MNTSKYFVCENLTAWKYVSMQRTCVKNYLMWHIFKPQYTVIDASTPKKINNINIIFLAVRDEESSEVFGAVVQYQIPDERGKLAYYATTEFDAVKIGTTCPKRIIAKLSPTENKNAQAWRRACLGLPPVNPDQLELFA